MKSETETILIVDYGSQYTQLIARRIRELEVFCLVYPFNKITKKILNEIKPSAFILSGGPRSVLDKNAPKLNQEILKMKKPVLAICYGMQLVTKNLKGVVKRSTHREYGHTIINIKKKSLLFKGINKRKIKVWMSHGDNINKIPKLFSITSLSNNKIISSIENIQNKIYCLQFHPEVTVELFDQWYDSKVSKKELRNYDVQNTRSKLIKNENLLSKKVNNFYIIQ